MPERRRRSLEWRSLLRAAWLIARREYLERIRSRAFLLTTILTPLALGVIFGGKLLSGDDSPGVHHLVIASPNHALARAVEQALSANTLAAAVEVIAPDNQPGALVQRVNTGDIDGYLWLDQKPGEALPSATYASRSKLGTAFRTSLEAAIRDGAMREQLLASGISTAQAAALFAPVNLKTEHIPGNASGVNSNQSATSTYLMIMLLYVVVIVYGMDVARSVLQEKTSRIFEVLLATTQPESLMLGKLLGVGAAGFTQVGAWCVLLGVASVPSLASDIGISGLGSLGISPLQLCFLVVYFVLGFLFYSGIAAAIGASLSGEQEIQQFAFLLVTPMLISVLLMDRVLRQPDSALAISLSFLPPCTPIVMYLRLCAQRPPAWQLALSIVLMLAAIALVVWIAARIYRVGILMYGKRPTVPELLRWLRYS